MSKGLLGQLKSTIFKKANNKNKIKRTIEVDASDEMLSNFISTELLNTSKTDLLRLSIMNTSNLSTIYAPPDPSTVGYLHDAANVITALDLSGGSRILDVACANGWLSEFLFRYGYDVTGVDISEDLLQVARNRIEAIKYTPYGRDKTSIRFKQLDIEKEYLEACFDAIIFYDCLHHFSDIDGVLGNAKKMLAPGGKVLIKEGAMPPKGSDGEKKLLQVFKEYNTLESPFDHEELKAYSKSIGFGYIKEYIEINGFFEKSPTELSKLKNRFVSPYDVNIFVCQTEKGDLPDINANALWHADISLKSLKEIDEGSRKYLELIFNIRNIGDSTWENDSNLKIGSTTLGIKLYSPAGNLVEEILGRTPLPKTVSPGEFIELLVYYPLSCIDIKGKCTMSVDMVLQGYFWFEQKGSKPLILTAYA
jgi:2-polyprenyl-3-methyl-5-hydroxy-6-metoxy-1,4-benzoquinol methylase